MIPKKIHYCWFSGKEMPSEYMAYIESWIRYCPDYEIIRWDESNYDVKKNQYMYSAYREGRWGFVPDYARLDIIYKEGGFYLDTDVELLKSLDELRAEKAFLGFEENNMINPGCGFGAEAGNPVILKLRDMYEAISFYKEGGGLNLTPSPHYITKELENIGIHLNNRLQRIEDLTVYPNEYFGAVEYTSGQANITEHTVSLHHYSSSWMTKNEKQLEDRRKEFCTRYGNFLGNRINGLCTRFDRLKAKNHGDIKLRLQDHFNYSEKKNEKRLKSYLNTEKQQIRGYDHIAMLSPMPGSLNLGDAIIEKYCVNTLHELGLKISNIIPTHTHPSKREQQYLKEVAVTIVAGSNLLSSDMHHCQWKLPGDYQSLHSVCLLGCGWTAYEGEINDFSKRFYQVILGNSFFHSVRDRYTEEKLKSIGLSNVLYTGCPTMWGLTPERCGVIPSDKSNTVVTALTSYNAEEELDHILIQKLLTLYEKVFFWPQGLEDEVYLSNILSKEELARVVVLERDLQALDEILVAGQVDYVGNRLHGGIYALNKGCRSIVVAIDNRATELGKDTNLPIIQRNQIQAELEKSILSKIEIRIDLPWNNIEKWKAQFMERNL